MISKDKLASISQSAADRGIIEFEKEFKKNMLHYTDFTKGYGESLAIKDSLHSMLEASISSALSSIVDELEKSK